MVVRAFLWNCSCVLLGLFILPNCSVDGAEADPPNPIVLALSEDYPPWSSGSGENVKGLAVDLIRAVMEGKMKKSVRFQGLPWVRAQKETFRGKFDGLCAVKSTERLDFLKPSAQPLYSSDVHLYTLKNPSAMDRVKDIKNLKSMQSADLIFNVYIGAGWAGDNLPEQKIQFSQSMESTIRKLSMTRGDAVADNALVIRYFIKKLDLGTRLYEHHPVIDRMTFYLLVGKNSPLVAELPKFDLAFASFVKTSEYRKIVSKYEVKAL